MLTNVSWSDPILINSIGHTAGLLAFGLILLLLIRDWRSRGVDQPKLPLLAALLALGWNAGSLVALGSGDGTSLGVRLVVTASFATLTLLPAVLLQVVLRGKHSRIVLAGYMVSGVATALHFSEVLFPIQVLHQAALLLIAVGFGLLTSIAFLLRRAHPAEEPAGQSDWILFGSLLLFAGSFLHFGYEHVSVPWAAEITWHHIGIPVALIILLQDYRFLLLDTFVRFLVNLALAAVYVGAVLATIQKLRLFEAHRPSTFVLGIALVMLCVSLIFFAYLRSALQGLVTRRIFSRSNIDMSVSRIAAIAVSVGSERELLARAAQEVARHTRAERFVISDEPANTSRRGEKPSVLPSEWAHAGAENAKFHAEAQIPLRFSSGENKFLVGGMRRGGRRYLSGDFDDLRRLGSAIVEQVERFRAEELKRLVTQAELRALQAQINPHFLFNALNTLYGTIDRKSFEARRMVLNLADIFRYLLQSDRAMIQLSEELRIVQAYLEIEALRLGDRLQTEMQISEAVKSATIPVLSIQPLVENAVKHGVAANSAGGRVCVKAEQVAGGVRISVTDTGSGFKQESGGNPRRAGVGLENVRRRLALCYGPAADLEIDSGEEGTRVAFTIPRDGPSSIAVAEMAESPAACKLTV